MAPWDRNKIEVLRELVVRGYTQSIIGRRLGISRSAAQTKITKLGFSELRPMRRRHRPVRDPLPPQAPSSHAHQLATMYPPLNVRLSDAGDFQCRWITGEPDAADTLICGQPAFYASWCPYHHSIGRTGNARRA